MKLFRTSQIAEIDRFTIDNEPIAGIDLMERAAKTVLDYIVSHTNWKGEVVVFSGPGNNGGDGLAVARLLAEFENRFKVKVCILDFGKGLKGSALINLQRIKAQSKVDVSFIQLEADLPDLGKSHLVIDALFGSGLNRALEGLPALIVQHINNSGVDVLAVDIPSGLMGEDNSDNKPDRIIKANTTLTFQSPKLSFLYPENEIYVGNWHVNSIGLHPKAIETVCTPYSLMERADVSQLIKPRTKFSHKGTFGHALLISGAYGKMGAAILASKACLRAGVGLLTTHIPHSAYQIVQTAVPEAMTCIDDSDIMFTRVDHLTKYNAIAVGPGIGQKVNTARGLKKLIADVESPLVIDADALNILGENKDWLNSLPASSVLTPHLKEFERIAGKSENSFKRMQLAQSFAQKYNVVLVVKGAHSMILNAAGTVWFNSTGNSGMATAGSGDVLTGIILALLAQGYNSFDAACVGVYVHGLAGDIALKTRGYESLIASDLIENLGEAFKLIHIA